MGTALACVGPRQVDFTVYDEPDLEANRLLDTEPHNTLQVVLQFT